MRLLRFLALLAGFVLPVVALVALATFAPLTTHVIFGVLITAIGAGLLLWLLWTMAGGDL